jgi:hypothetical protein
MHVAANVLGQMRIHALSVMKAYAGMLVAETGALRVAFNPCYPSKYFFCNNDILSYFIFYQTLKKIDHYK